MPARWAVVFWDEGGQILVRRDVPRFAELVRAQELQEFLPAVAGVRELEDRSAELDAPAGSPR